MKVIYIGKTIPLELTNGKIYETLSIERDWYRIVDDTGEDYLYPPELFKLLNDKSGDCNINQSDENCCDSKDM